MGENSSLTQFCPLWHGPNDLVEKFLTINVFLLIQGFILMVRLFPMAILLHHGEVPCDDVLISRQSSNFENFPSAKFTLEPFVSFGS
jgi:hypothetical protein